MPHIAPRILDAALQAIVSDSDRFVALSDYPASYAQVATYALGTLAVTGASFIGPEASADGYGRRVRLQAFSGGVAAASGTARFWSLVDDTTSARLVVQQFEAPMPIVAGTPWGIETALVIGIPGWPDVGGVE